MNINPVQRQSLLSFGSLAAITGIGYISTFYFAHFLGPAVLGSYFLFLAYYGIFDLIGDGGFGGAAIKRISEGKAPNEYFTAFFILRIVLLILSIVTFIAISPFLTGMAKDGLLYWLILALVAGTLAGITSVNLYGSTQIGIMQVSSLVNTIIKNLVQILAVFIGCGLGGLVAGFIAGMIVAAVINFRFIQLGISRCNRSHFTGLLSYSSWTFLSSSGSLIFSYADTILIALFMTETDIGIYRIALQLSAAATFIVFAFYTVLFPRISKWSTDKDFSSIENALTRTITYSLFFAIPITAGGIILSEKILYYLYGAAFQPGAPILIILLFSQVVYVFSYLQTLCLNAMDKPRVSFLIILISAVLNVILIILLIPTWGIAGVAYAALISMGVNAVLAYAMLRSSIRIRVDMKAIANLVLSSLIMSIFIIGYLMVFPLRNIFDLILSIGISSIIYFVVVLGIDRTIRNDLKILLDTMNFPLIP